MFVSYIYVSSRSDDDKSTKSSILCIILTDSETKGATLPAAPAAAPPSPDYVSDSPDHTRILTRIPSLLRRILKREIQRHLLMQH
uniref:Uncharacterized protein n=1 Tax=Tanacetum cinerariifolium TaxID=118510 RepID=A0A699HRK9_TANCI|nr:hypothetical protein [Tanacetum cinerariifolium]